LNVSPVDTAKMLVAHLDLAAAAGGDAGRRSEALSKRIKDALESLKSIDPSLLELPAYERGVPRANGR
jgi:hypothetical protein